MKLHNRVIKAEFWTDSEVQGWDFAKQLLYLGLIQLCDDSSCLEADPGKLKGFLFPLRTDITPAVIEQYLNELIQARKVIPYTVNGTRCLHLKNFFRHQALRSPGPPDTPLPPWVQWVPSDTKYRSGNYILCHNLRQNAGKKRNLQSLVREWCYMTGGQTGEICTDFEPENANRTETVRKPYGNRKSTVPRARAGADLDLEKELEKEQGQGIPDTGTVQGPVDPAPAPAPSQAREEKNSAGKEGDKGKGKEHRGRIPKGCVIHNGEPTDVRYVPEDRLRYLAAHAENPKVGLLCREELHRREMDGQAAPAGGNGSGGKPRTLEELVGFVARSMEIPPETVRAAVLDQAGGTLPTDPAKLQLLVAQAVSGMGKE